MPTTNKVSWHRIFIEGTVIVTSILLAFGIDAWWDKRNELADEQRYLAGLKVEFTENVAAAQNVIARHELFAERVDRLVSMTNEDIMALEGDSIEEFMRAMMQYMTFEPSGGSLSSLLSAGRLSVIQDDALRDQLVEWLRLLDDLSEEAGFLTRASERITLAASQQIDLRKPLDAEDLLRVRHDDDMMGIIRAKLFFATLYTGELRSLLSHAESILVAVRADLI